ncbi:MAG TPA: hypothetical protein VJS20_02005 [Gemmatimonadales bacterium]|nr:hypothetical protein [Gemmatimonadales bacterium]
MSAILLVDNLFSPVHFPDVVLAANEELAGSEAEMFSTLRREDGWEPTTYNNDAWLKATHTQPRAVNMVCLWAHNLRGETYRLQVSNNDFTAASDIETLVDVVIPSNPGTGSPDDALGVLTEDLMWIKRVPTRYGVGIRHFVPVMGANQRPRINGIVGMGCAFDRDRGDLVDANDFRAAEQRSPRGVVGYGEADVSRSGAVPISLTTLSAYEDFRYHLQRYDGTAFGAPSPGLLIFDESRTEQAVMIHRPQGRSAFTQRPNYFYPSGELAFEEHDHA